MVGCLLVLEPGDLVPIPPLPPTNWRPWQADSGSELRFPTCEIGIDAPDGGWEGHCVVPSLH